MKSLTASILGHVDAQVKSVELFVMPSMCSGLHVTSSGSFDQPQHSKLYIYLGSVRQHLVMAVMVVRKGTSVHGCQADPHLDLAGPYPCAATFAVVVQGLLSELDSHSGDPLACCAALATLQQLLEAATPSAALLLHDLLMERLLPLLDDSLTTAAAAVNLAANIVARAAAAAAAGSGRAAAHGSSNGNHVEALANGSGAASGGAGVDAMAIDGGALAALTGAAPHPLLCKLSAMLDER